MRRLTPIRVSAMAFAALVPAILAWAPIAASAQSHSEYDVKAAMIFQLTRVVEWPDETHDDASPMRIGILGTNPFGDALETMLADKPSPMGEGFSVVTVTTLEEGLTCEIVFVPQGSKPEMMALVPDLVAGSVLVIGEESRFAELDGGILALVQDGRRMRMVLNMSAMATSRLQASSKFMRLCRIVGDASR